MRKLIFFGLILIMPVSVWAWTITNNFDSCSGPSGWSCWNSSGTASIVSSESAPGSSPNSLQIFNPKNAGDSSVPGGASLGFTPTSELWVQTWFKYKSNFDFHQGNNKLIYLRNGANGSNTIVFDTSFGNDYAIWPLPIACQTWYPPNIQKTKITSGVWYKFVFHIKVNGNGGTEKDIFEYWINDVKQAYYTNACLAPSGNPTYSEITLDPVWGGQMDSGPNVDNYQWYDYTIVSTDPIPVGSGGVAGGDAVKIPKAPNTLFIQ